MKTTIKIFIGIALVVACSCSKKMKDFSPGYEIACYYFPNYHPTDNRNNKFHGPGWSEWELVKKARPRFPGHQQPKVPLWGYTDESDPQVMAQKIDAAADHGIDVFIFDWYYFDDGPFCKKHLNRDFSKPKIIGASSLH